MTARSRPGFIILSTLLLTALAATALAKPASKWRIECDHKSDNAGEIILRIAPEGGQPIDVTTRIPEKTGENHAAHILRDSLRASLGEGYKVEVDDGEDVLIKRKGKTPKFEVTLVSSSVAGLSVGIKKE